MHFPTTVTLVALFMVTVFVACLGVAILPDALSSQPHSRLFKEATERSSVSGKISAIGDASFSVDANMGQDPAEPTSLLTYSCSRRDKWTRFS